MNAIEADHWLRSDRKVNEPRLRVIGVPYAGGSATIFRPWQSLLPEDVELRAVQLPARQDRLKEPGIRSVDELVDRLTAAIEALPPAPLVLYGHSFGTLVAFELARRLLARRLAVRALAVGARRAPQLARREAPIFGLGDRAFLDALHRRYGISRSIIDNAELIGLALPSLRADFEALETYVHRPEPLDVPVVGLHGRQDASVDRAEAAAWAEVTSGVFSFVEVDGGHYFVDTHRAWVVSKVLAAGLGPDGAVRN